MASIELRHLNKYYDEVWAVRDLNLKIRDHEFLTLLGPSGCGKTTTLNIIAGLDAPSSGEVYIDGKPITAVEPAKRDVAMVFQNYALYPHMTVYRNLAFGLEIRKTPKDQVERQVKQAARMLNIEALLDRHPAQLSGGQRQRVALGRALVRNPKAFLLDEPLSNLDPVMRMQMRAEIKMLFNRLKTTAVFVTHDQAEAMTMSDRIAIMNNGVLQQVDTPRNIYHAPVNVFVAGFVGSPPMNLLKVTVTETGRLALAGVHLDAPDDCLLTPYTNQLLILGIRPEDLRPGSFGDVRASVEVVEDLGALKIVYMRLQGELIALKIDADRLGALRIGDGFNLDFEPERLYLFDPASGATIRVPARAYAGES